MLSTVIGSFPVDLDKPTSFKNKLFNSIGFYDPYKIAIKRAVIAQLDAGVDIVSDGQVRGDMVSIFTEHIDGMEIRGALTVINSKISNNSKGISTNDLKYVKKIINEYYNGNVPENKGFKGIVTGPSTIIYSSKIESYYKNKNDAIIDLAHELKKEINAICDVGVKYIQIDEPFLSTGLVNMKIAKEAIDILTEDVEIPMGMHVCGTLDNVFKDLTKFNLDILDFEFAGNDVNLKILEENVYLIKNKKIGFGCLDSSVNEVDSVDDVSNLINKGIEIVGKDKIILSPDCGLRKLSYDVACKKLKVMNKIKEEL